MLRGTWGLVFTMGTTTVVFPSWGGDAGFPCLAFAAEGFVQAMSAACQSVFGAQRLYSLCPPVDMEPGPLPSCSCSLRLLHAAGSVSTCISRVVTSPLFKETPFGPRRGVEDPSLKPKLLGFA